MKKYVVKQIIGEGAYGVVMKCRHKSTNELVAIKKFKDSEDDSEARRTISRELTMLQKLKHQNIVGLRETFRRKGKLYMVFDFVEKNILQLLEENPDGIDVNLVRSYTYQLVRAIYWCHENDVIHRDVKPENLLISSDNVLKLCDFGFARSIITSTAPYTDYVATRWYRAPELLLGGLYGPAIDIWSIGCIMGELADGKPVFPGDSEIDQLYVIQKVLGPLPDDLMDLFSNSPRFSGLKFPPIQQPLKSLTDRYSAKLDLELIDFLKSVLNMSASQRPTASACEEHPAFRGLSLANGGDMRKTASSDNSAAKTEKFEICDQHPSNLGCSTLDSVSSIGDKKNNGNTEPEASPSDNVNLDQSDGSHQNEDLPVDFRTSMREAEKTVDDRGLVPLIKLKGKKPTQSNDLPCPVFSDFNQKLAECNAIKGTDKRPTSFETGATTRASLPPTEMRRGLNTVASLQEETEEAFASTAGVLTDAGKDNEIGQSFLPNPRSKYYQMKSMGMALWSGPTSLLLAGDLGQNRTLPHAILPPQKRRNESEVGSPVFDNVSHTDCICLCVCVCVSVCLSMRLAFSI
jgi:cyclin-dependent kinase-like